MSQEIVKVEFTQEQINLIRSQIAPKATNDELKLFLYHAQRTGLDPLARQIYAIHRNAKDGDKWVQKMSIQTSIDGFRVIAERSGVYAGQDEPEFDEDIAGTIRKATVKVYKWKGDTRYLAAVGVAYWAEYCQTDKEGRPMGLWGKMPHTMLAKVAEALALRKAFPQDLSGLYTGDEMEQTANELPAQVDYAGRLRECDTLGDLAAEWKNIPKQDKPKFEAIKEEIKASLQTQPAQEVEQP